MQRSDFSYALPPERIAQQPTASRGASRLLHLDAQGEWRDRMFSELPALLRAGDLLVFNDTRVIPARLFGRKDSGGRVEVLVERVLDRQRVNAQLRASKSPRAGSRLYLDGDGEGDVVVTVEGREGDLFRLDFGAERPVLDILDAHGHIPLPPYIDRPDDAADRERYQTVFARRPGAVAAPTAGLHFDQQVLDQLAAQGVGQAFVTLHVGAGTFQPVRVERLEEHKMHPEYLQVSAAVVEKIQATRAAGGRVVAVGTTVVRSLEAASQGGRLAPFEGDTELFITPGYRFRSVDALLTNFHLPESTLLMLVCAFGGYEPVMAAYRHAVQAEYRFFSYGDAMFIERGKMQDER